MNFFDSLSNMATQSTIYKRHERRHGDGNATTAAAAAAVQPVVHTSQHAQDPNLMVTLQKFGTRSTVYKHHEDFHQDMGHDSASKRTYYVQPNMAHHHDSLVETLASFTSDSSIYERNVLRNQFLHSS